MRDALLSPIGSSSAGSNAPSGQLELAFIRALARCASRDAVHELLSARLVDELADELWSSATRLAAGDTGVSTGAELHDKFQQEADVFTLDYGGLSQFHSGPPISTKTCPTNPLSQPQA